MSDIEYTIEITKVERWSDGEEETTHVEHLASSYDFDWQYIGNELMEAIKNEEQRRIGG
jgi:hypothetical protein